MSMDIQILVWDQLKMCGGIKVVKCILSLTLMIGSPVALLIYKNRENKEKQNKVCVKSCSILLYVLRPYQFCSCHCPTNNVYSTKQRYFVHRYRVWQFIREKIENIKMCDPRSGVHITNGAEERATRIPLVISVKLYWLKQQDNYDTRTISVVSMNTCIPQQLDDGDCKTIEVCHYHVFSV